MDSHTLSMRSTRGGFRLDDGRQHLVTHPRISGSVSDLAGFPAPGPRSRSGSPASNYLTMVIVVEDPEYLTEPHARRRGVKSLNR